ncbi:MAG TPA: hypothetical protein PKH10_05765, partial [bacterium]|nr:hypothetical protein [bacterium]
MDSEGNDLTPPDLTQLFAWGELKYGAETKTTEAVWMGDDDATLRFTGLPYGVSMSLTLTMRAADTDGDDSDIVGLDDVPEVRTDNIVYYCTSQAFSLTRGTVTDVNNACVMQEGPAAGEGNKPGAPVMTLSYTDDDDKETTIDTATEFKTPKKIIAIEFTAPNDNFDTVVVANDTGFALGRKEYPKPEKANGAYRIESHDLDDGLPVTTDGSRTIALKLRNALGFESLAA